MTLQNYCAAAEKAGRDIDLRGCDYGPHKRTNQHLGVQPYYHFLAGFAQTTGCRKVLEIGTSYGGSMMAINRGCGVSPLGLELVTVDKIDLAGQGLIALTHITRIHGDSLLPATIRYLSYDTEFPFSSALFKPPPDITMTEAKASSQ